MSSVGTCDQFDCFGYDAIVRMPKHSTGCAAGEKPVDLPLQAIRAEPPPDPDAAHRRDLTHLRVVTVDDPGTREVDDALSIERLPSGLQRLWIHVADPSRWLVPGHPLDLAAQSRGVTMYLPSGMIPLFPWVLAEGVFSLTVNEERCALSFGAVLDDQGALADVTVVPSKVVVDRRFSYEDVDAIIGQAVEEGDSVERDLAMLHQWAKKRCTL